MAARRRSARFAPTLTHPLPESELAVESAVVRPSEVRSARQPPPVIDSQHTTCGVVKSGLSSEPPILTSGGAEVQVISTNGEWVPTTQGRIRMSSPVRTRQTADYPNGYTQAGGTRTISGLQFYESGSQMTPSNSFAEGVLVQTALCMTETLDVYLHHRYTNGVGSLLSPRHLEGNVRKGVPFVFRALFYRNGRKVVFLNDVEVADSEHTPRSSYYISVYSSTQGFWFVRDLFTHTYMPGDDTSGENLIWSYRGGSTDLASFPLDRAGVYEFQCDDFGDLAHCLVRFDIDAGYPSSLKGYITAFGETKEIPRTSNAISPPPADAPRESSSSMIQFIPPEGWSLEDLRNHKFKLELIEV